MHIGLVHNHIKYNQIIYKYNILTTPLFKIIPNNSSLSLKNKYISTRTHVRDHNTNYSGAVQKVENLLANSETHTIDKIK